MVSLISGLMLLCLFAVGCGAQAAGKTLRIGLVQTVIESTLEANRAKIVHFIREASEARCDVAVFPENALYWPKYSSEVPSKVALDAAIEQIRWAAKEGGLAVVFGVAYRNSDSEEFANRAIVFGPDGELLQAYWKSREVPRPFDMGGTRCSFLICADRWYLEQSDLPSLVSGASVIIDISGGHGGDDGAPDLPWLRYRQWAARNGTWVAVTNPVHEDTDFMGRSPWGGRAAVIRPDGSLQVARMYQKDEMIVTDIDLNAATLDGAERRRRHPLLREFWDLGEKLLAGGTMEPSPELKPYQSAVRDIKIGAAQIACSADTAANRQKIVEFIGRAASEKADIVVFPELALTGSGPAAVRSATQEAIDEALRNIQDAAKTNGIYVIVGTPLWADGVRRNGAVVIGDDGTVLTRYAQIAADRPDLFAAGQSARAMWFSLKGVHSIVTIGADADWVEMGDLAANRGMSLHFHISSEEDASAEATRLRKQRYVLALAYAQFGAAVNTADGGGSMIVSREGGHEKPPPPELEHYLPYQTSIVRSTAAGDTIVYATRRSRAHNPLDLHRRSQNRRRKTRQESGWYEWIKVGTRLIESEAPHASLFSDAGPFDGNNFKGRIAYSADGNHNDPDDWAASPLALALFAAFGVKDKLVHFDYNSILNNTDAEWEKTHQASVLGAVERYGYDRRLFHDCRQNLEAAVASITGAVNASTAENPLYFIVAGPMQVPVMGLLRSSPEARKHVYVISHSHWNDGLATRYSFKNTKRDVIALGVNWVQIRDQNRLLAFGRYGRPAQPEEFEPYFWMRDSQDPKVRFLWERMVVSTRPDPSDSGMAYFLLTGDEEAEPAKYRRLLDEKVAPQPVEVRLKVRIEAENFETLDGYEMEITDRTARAQPVSTQSLSHRAGIKPTEGVDTGRIRTSFSQPYTAARGRYDVEIRYFDEPGRRSRFALFVNGRARGSAWESAGTRQGWTSRTIRDVEVRAGDEIGLDVSGPPARLDYVQLNLRPAFRFKATGALDDPKALPGQIIVAGRHPGYLKYNGGGTAFLCGPDNPEDFLFLGDLNADGTRSNGPRQLIIDRMAEAGVNAFHFQMFRMRRCNIKDEGDDQHNPFVNFDPAQPLNEAVLEQWDGWISQLEEAGIVIHLEFYNDATDVEMMGWKLERHPRTQLQSRRYMWSCAMSGMHTLEAGHNALRAPGLLADDGRIVEFMEQTDFYTMRSHDELAHGSTKWVLANPGDSYIAYTYDYSGPMGVKDMTAGTYDLKWFDTVDGNMVSQSSVAVSSGDVAWNKPGSLGSEIALYIKRRGAAGAASGH